MKTLKKPVKDFPKSGENYDFNKYAAAVGFATIIFLLGIFLGNYFVQEKISAINEMQDSVRLEVMSMELQNQLFQERPCSDPMIPLEGKLEEITSKITSTENRLGKDNTQVLEIKKYYSLIEINHYLLMKSRKDKCNSDYSLVLFFYSNKNNVLESEKQGYVLDNLKGKYTSDKIKVYSFDRDLDLDIIKTIVSFYNITDVPTTIIDEKKLEGFHDKEEVEELIA
jgi:hypothetical protein